MVKKRLASGEPCEKCAQAEEMLRRRNYWDRIDEILWAVEGDETSAGARKAAEHGVKLAPFFVVEQDGVEPKVVTSTLRLLKQHLEPSEKSESSTAPSGEVRVDDLAARAVRELAGAPPIDILRFGLEQFGERCAISFSGGEEVVLIDMATRLDLPFSVISVDSGRLHAETYEYLDDIRRRFGCEIDVALPDAAELSELLRTKGTNSFLRDGHHECCGIRKLSPLRRQLTRYDAWVTGERRETRSAEAFPVVRRDEEFRGASGDLLRLDPLAGLSRVEVIEYARKNEVPLHPLYKKGFARIDCLPCTRPVSDTPGEADRWWWEEGAAEPTPVDPGSGI